MLPALVFKYHTDCGGADLYEVKDDKGATSLIEIGFSGIIKAEESFTSWQHSFVDFASFWHYLTSKENWYGSQVYYIHPSVRLFVLMRLQAQEPILHHSISWRQKHRYDWEDVLYDVREYE